MAGLILCLVESAPGAVHSPGWAAFADENRNIRVTAISMTPRAIAKQRNNEGELHQACPDCAGVFSTERFQRLRIPMVRRSVRNHSTKAGIGKVCLAGEPPVKKA